MILKKLNNKQSQERIRTQISQAWETHGLNVEFGEKTNSSIATKIFLSLLIFFLLKIYRFKSNRRYWSNVPKYKNLPLKIYSSPQLFMPEKSVYRKEPDLYYQR